MTENSPPIGPNRVCPGFPPAPAAETAVRSVGGRCSASWLCVPSDSVFRAHVFLCRIRKTNTHQCDQSSAVLDSMAGFEPSLVEINYGKYKIVLHFLRKHQAKS